MNKFNKLKTKIKWKATKNYEIFMPSIFFCVCVCIKCVKSATKLMENVKLRLLMIKNTSK